MRHTAVILGRFQPFHRGHLATFAAASIMADRVVVVLGSAGAPVSLRNPWDVIAREAMIKDSLTDMLLDRVRFTSVGDYKKDSDWVGAVREAVSPFADRGPVFLVGVGKDKSTSDYLNMFKNEYEALNWPVFSATPQYMIHGSSIRKNYFSNYSSDVWGEHLTDPVKDALMDFHSTNTYTKLMGQQLEENKRILADAGIRSKS